MENLYTVQTKLLDGKTYYFVKKFLKLTEFKGLADVVTGYGMHTDFEKACSIAGINDKAVKHELLLRLEVLNLPQEPLAKKTITIPETVNRLLAEQGAELLN